MSSKSDVFENELLDLIFLNEAIGLIGDSSGLQPSATGGSLYCSLHTGEVGETGDQTTNEVTYTPYVRRGIVRTASGWTVSSNQVSNAAAITFPQRTDAGAAQVATHWALGTAGSGAGMVLYKGPLGTVCQGPFTAKTDDTITIPGHTLAVDERVAFYPAFGSSLPTGITEGTLYWVITVSGDDITVSETQGGGAVNISAVGDGVAYEARTLSISQNVTPEFAIGALVIQED